MILVTGATGHIGNVLVKQLLAQGNHVRALLLPCEDRTPLQRLAVELYEADILDYSALQEAFRNVDIVFHLAGLISILPGRDDRIQAVNVIGTRNILYACREHSIDRLVYTSSIHALRRVPHGILIDEHIPFDPEHALSAYDGSKARASLEVLAAADRGLDAVIVCPTGVIGPYDYRGSEIGQIILECVEHKPQLYIDGAYDFVDVRDVVDGLIRAWQCGRRGETYILSGEQLSVRRLLELVWRATGRRVLSLRIPLSIARFGSKWMPYYYYLSGKKPRFTPYSLATLASNSLISHAKAEQELSYQPRPLAESIADTVRWFDERRCTARSIT